MYPFCRLTGATLLPTIHRTFPLIGKNINDRWTLRGFSLGQTIFQLIQRMGGITSGPESFGHSGKIHMREIARYILLLVTLLLTVFDPTQGIIVEHNRDYRQIQTLHGFQFLNRVTESTVSYQVDDSISFFACQRCSDGRRCSPAQAGQPSRRQEPAAGRGINRII
jgi:hypothetical protein